MIALKLIAEGLGLGFLLYLICAVGIRNGAVGMVHLFDPEVQERVVKLGLTTMEEIRKRSVRFRSLCLPGYLIYVLLCVPNCVLSPQRTCHARRYSPSLHTVDDGANMPRPQIILPFGVFFCTGPACSLRYPGNFG